MLIDSPPEDFKEVFNVNVVGVQIVTMTFLPLLKKGTKKTIVNISSFLASLEYTDGRFRNFAFHAYCLSKTAVNYLVRDYAQEFAEEGFTVIAVNPGVRSVEWLTCSMSKRI
jgi:NAD(P)-dependent dehydrogenase (short-subunit alcohol dehydrogenase family)